MWYLAIVLVVGVGSHVDCAQYCPAFSHWCAYPVDRSTPMTEDVWMALILVTGTCFLFWVANHYDS